MSESLELPGEHDAELPLQLELDSESALPLWGSFRELITTLNADLRQSLAAEWLQAASFEHASIASFNRFSLELLSVGAPADLVARANSAALDEVRHARHSFAVGSLYAGQALGAGALDLRGLQLLRLELTTAAFAAAEEGCVAETLAAAEAAAAAEHAEHPLLRALLTRIAREEGEHAALAYRFVGWALEVGGDAVRSAARAGFNAALARAQQPSSDAPRAEHTEWPQHGRLLHQQREAVRSQTVAEVLEPAARQLFG